MIAETVRRSVYAAVLAVCAVGPVAAGCGRILGVDGYKVAPPLPDAATTTSTYGYWKYASADCAHCMDQNCSDAATRCQKDPTCNSFAACEAACPAGDTECAASTCRSMMPFLGGYNSLESVDLEACRSTNCSSACGTLRSQGKTCGFPFERKDCGSCCCAETAACAKDPECLRTFQCMGTCDAMTDVSPLSDPCVADCLGHPEQIDAAVVDAGSGVSAGMDVWQCFTTSCASSCQVQDWSCAGKVQIPKPSSGPPVFYLHVLAFGSPSAPVANLYVRACEKADFYCGQPLWTGHTDSRGSVGIPIQQGGLGGGDLYFDLTDPENPPRVAEMLMYQPNLSSRFTSLLLPPPPPASSGWDPTWDPNLGAIIGYVADCYGGQGGHASVALTPSDASMLQVGYYIGGAVDLKAPCTDTSGGVWAQNVPPGYLNIEVSRCEGTRVGSAKVIIRPGAETEVMLGPFDY